MNRRSMARIKAAAERAAIWVNPLTLQHAARDINTAAALVGMQLTGDVLQQVKTAFGHLAAAATPGAGQGELRQAGAAATRLITNADQYAGSSLPGHALRSRGPGSWAPGKLLSLPDQPAAAPGPHRGLPVHGRVPVVGVQMPSGVLLPELPVAHFRPGCPCRTGRRPGLARLRAGESLAGAGRRRDVAARLARRVPGARCGNRARGKRAWEILADGDSGLLPARQEATAGFSLPRPGRQEVNRLLAAVAAESQERRLAVEARW
jgi:hypothetical protein